MMVSPFQNLAQVFAGRLLNTFFDGIAIAVLVWVVLRLTGRQNSGTRFVLWFAALACIVILPFFAGALAPLAVKTAAEFSLPGSWALGLFCAWAAISGVLLLRLMSGLWQIRKFRANCREIDPRILDRAAADLPGQLALRRKVKLCVSDAIAVPSVMGFFRPMIVFPAWLAPELSPEELSTVLSHELAHLRRWDDWSNLCQKIIKALLFFHPAVWWIENRLTLEREMACDDVVLAQSASPRTYAATLISFAEKIQQGRGITLAQAFIGRVAQMSVRIAQILDADRPGRTQAWRPVLGVSAAVLTLVFLGAPYTPQLVAFESQPQSMRQVELSAKTASGGVVASGHVPSISSQAHMIPAAFHPGKAVSSAAKAIGHPQARLALAKAQNASPNRETLVVFQSTQYDASGKAVWTLCIWTVREGNSGDRQIESAIVLHSI